MSVWQGECARHSSSSRLHGASLTSVEQAEGAHRRLHREVQRDRRAVRVDEIQSLSAARQRAQSQRVMIPGTRSHQTGGIMRYFPGKLIIICSAVLVLSVIANGSLAEPKSGRSTPAGGDTSASTGATGNTMPSSPQSSDGSNGSWAGGDGQLETSIRLKDTWSLELGVGVDPEQQSSSPTGDINGRVGFGFRF